MMDGQLPINEISSYEKEKLDNRQVTGKTMYIESVDRGTNLAYMWNIGMGDIKHHKIRETVHTVHNGIRFFKSPT